VPLLYNEDGAIRRKLQGLVVDDAAAPAGREVVARFREPEDELADQTFPLILIDHAGISYDRERAHAGYGPLPYAPEGYQEFAGAPDMTGSPYYTEFPLPMFVDYVVTLYTRKDLHRAQLIPPLMAFERIPPRFGFLVVPEDKTVRRLDVLGGPTFVEQLDSAGKRLMLTMWKLRTTMEILWAPIDEPSRATDIDLTVTTTGESS
jgi:hypothetical protein